MKYFVSRNISLARVAFRLFVLFLCGGLWMGAPAARADDPSPSTDHSLARFGNAVALESFELPGASKPVPGYPFTVVLHWQVLNPLDQEFIATVSLNNGSRQVLVQFDAPLPSGLQAGQRISTSHTLLVPEVSPDTTLYFVTQRQTNAPIVMQAWLRDAQYNQRVPMTLAQTRVRRAYSAVLATWRREELALSECHITEIISTTNAINAIILTRPSKGELTQGYWYAHRGADFADVRGRPVRAAQAGQVVMSQWNLDGFGYMVEIEHAPFEDAAGTHTFQTLYAHLDQLSVRVGQRVKAGQIIGKLGLTGNATGPHLHFEVRVDRVPKNPFCFLPR